MTEIKKRLPVGVDIFDKLISHDFYYVDKTLLIRDLVRNCGEVNLFTRPRRFGKSLNMSMLKSFFEIGCDKSFFDDLKISEYTDICEEYMGQYPVVSVSLKGVDGLDFAAAVKGLQSVIRWELSRFSFLKDSEKLSSEEKKLYDRYVMLDWGSVSDCQAMIASSLSDISALLCRHYGRKTIILIDEYDVPLDKAFQQGYYDEMVVLLRTMFGNALKSNPNLMFAVLTGCLRISKESIFTGLNNLKVLSVLNPQFDEYFGFTDDEVRDMLMYYGLMERYETVREWYDGYLFGRTDVYCPWDVISYLDDLTADSMAVPQDYWSNTSGNAIVRRLIARSDIRTKNEIEKLISGESIEKEIRQELTYSEIDNSIENIWSVLFTTGYLTQRGRTGDDIYKLIIPNREIRKLFVRQVREWFMQSVKSDSKAVQEFCAAFPAGNTEQIETLFGNYLWNTISIRDISGREKKENFYHGIVLGLLGSRGDWLVKSNAESGEGYSDILIEIPETRTGIVIEMKYAEDGRLDEACAEAVRQIEERSYDAALENDGMTHIMKYGIACYKKRCRVVLV